MHPFKEPFDKHNNIRGKLQRKIKISCLMKEKT